MPADERVIRTCGFIGPDDEERPLGRCNFKAGYGTRQEICSCGTDLCNAASPHIPSIMLVLLCSIIYLKI